MTFNIVCLRFLATRVWELCWTGQGSRHCFCWIPMNLDRPALWRNLDAHAQPVWIPLQARPGDERSRAHSELGSCTACQCAVKNAKSRVIHKDNRWSDAKWYSELACYETQLWRVDPCKDRGSGWWSRPPREVVPIPVQSLLGDRESYRHNFHWFDGPPARLLCKHLSTVTWGMMGEAYECNAWSNTWVL